MSHYPGYGPPPGPGGGPPPPYFGPGHPPPPPPGWQGHHRPPHTYPGHGSSGSPYPPPDGGALNTQPAPYPYYVPGAFMVPIPVAPMPAGPPPSDPNPTYITNYIYHGETVATNTVTDGAAVELSGEFDWVPTTSTTASHLTGKAVVGGHEGWDGSPLWVIRAWHQGDLIPGKFSIRHNSATIAYDGKEIPVQNMEVLVGRPESLRWIPATNGNIPPNAVVAGNTASGEPLYAGRARHQLSVTPGKVHPSHGSCYISFAGQEIAFKIYDVLCRIS